MTTMASGLAAGEVRVAHADALAFGVDPGRVEHALTWLGAAERERARRYRHDADRHMFLLGRVMARTMVGDALGLAPHAWTWREGPHGRPEIAEPPTSIRFNLSHSAGLVMCVVADGRDVGVDVEHLDRRAPDRALVRRYCSPREADAIDARGDDWIEPFLSAWTLKEAYLKARGLGISVALADLSFEMDAGARPRVSFERSLAGEDPRWWFELWRPAPRHLAAVAVSTAGGPAPRLVVSPFA